MEEKTISRTTHFEGRVFDVERIDIEMPDGTPSIRDIVRHPGAIGVVARKPCGSFVFVRQYRKAVEKIMTEIIAGLLEKGEDPEVCARREILEETGHHTRSLTALGIIHATPGYVDEKIYLFFAELEEDTREQDLDHDEYVEPVTFTREAFEAKIREGGITDGKTLAAWLLYDRHVGS